MSTDFKQTVFLKMKNILHKTAYITLILNYVGHLESKEHLRIQPAQLFHFR